MIAVFEDVKNGEYCRNKPKVLEDEKANVSDALKALDDIYVDDDDEARVATAAHHGEVVDVTTMPGGEVCDSEYHICLQEVPIITPCGDVVVSKLSFEVDSNT